MLHIHYKARQDMKHFLQGAAKPRDISPRVWDSLCIGHLGTMSGHTLICLIDDFGLSDIKQILEYCEGWERTIFEAGKIQSALTGTNSLEEDLLKKSER